MNKVYKLINHKRIENILNHCLFFSAQIITVSHVFLTKILHPIFGVLSVWIIVLDFMPSFLLTGEKNFEYVLDRFTKSPSA